MDGGLGFLGRAGRDFLLMYCIFDTETSGLFDFAKPADAPGQPRLASIAMLAADEHLNLIAATFVMVRPEGWTMPAEAQRINGLSQHLLETNGVPVGEVLWRYAQEIERGAVMVAHNAQYDAKIMRGEMRRAGMPDLYTATPTICTMKALEPVLRIPKATGRGWKWPKLAEAVRQCLGRDHANAHGALPDALACLDLLRWMKREGCMPNPSLASAA